MYAARRLILAVPLLLGMSVLVFGLMRLVPGDPAVVVLGYKATPEGVRALREAFHLDEPPPEQYVRLPAALRRGAIVVEMIFTLPGVGRMTLDAVLERNYPVVQSTVLVIGAMFMLVNLATDILYGVVDPYRVSLGVAVTAALLAVVVGGPLGLIAGYAEGLPDQLIMRPLDVLMAFPAVLLAIALMSVFGTGALLVSVALAVVYIPVVARVVRAAVLATKVEVYVDGARALGATMPRLVLTHILPNAAAPMLVQASVLMAIGILIEAALSFLGVGVRPPTPSLGLMLADGRGFMVQAPWMVVCPGLAVMLAVLGFNMLADGLRDWLDPQHAAAR